MFQALVGSFWPLYVGPGSARFEFSPGEARKRAVGWDWLEGGHLANKFSTSGIMGTLWN